MSSSSARRSRSTSAVELPIVKLEGKRVDPEVLALVPQAVAEKHNVLPLFLKDLGAGQELYVGMENPCDRIALEDVARHADLAVEPVIVAASELAVAIDRLYRDGLPARDTATNEDLEDITETLAPLPSAAAAALPAAANPGEADTRTILQALSQLLIEADLIDRAALIARIAQLESARRS
jgi:hypothetical protein